MGGATRLHEVGCYLLPAQTTNTSWPVLQRMRARCIQLSVLRQRSAVPALLARSWVPKSIIARRPVQLSSGHQNSATSAMIERGCCRGALATYAAVAPEQRTAAQRAALSKCWPNSPPPHRPRGSQRPTAAPADETSVRSSAAQSRASTYVVLRMTE